MQQPLISVIIPNYNYAHYLPQAIDSVLAQTYPSVEIVAVDDGSNDDSLNVLASYGAHIKWVKQQNSGVSAARNHGARISSGSYLAFLDADDYWLPTKLARQMELYQHDPELGLTHCGIEEFDSVQGTVNQRQDGLSGWVARELLLFERSVILGPGSNLIAPRDLFDKAGGFDERLSTSADWECSYRLASLRRVGFTPELLVRCRMHGSNMHNNIAAMEHDMLLGYSKAFANPPDDIVKLRRRCYGNLHMTLAGSYYQSGQYLEFASHAWRSLCFTPARAGQLVGYPLRWWRRHS